MYIYIFIYLFIYLLIHIYIYIYLYLFIYTSHFWLLRGWQGWFMQLGSPHDIIHEEIFEPTTFGWNHTHTLVMGICSTMWWYTSFLDNSISSNGVRAGRRDWMKTFRVESPAPNTKGLKLHPHVQNQQSCGFLGWSFSFLRISIP